MILAIIVICVVLLGTISFLSKDRILLAVGDFLVVQDELKPVDVIHVIAGDDYRTDYAIQLYKQGMQSTYSLPEVGVKSMAGSMVCTGSNSL